MEKKRIGHTPWIICGIAVVFGLILLIWPGITPDFVMYVTGAMLIVTGGLGIVRYFRKKSPYDAYDWDAAFGLAGLLSGILMIVMREQLTELLFMLFGLALIFCGFAKLQLALNLRRVLYRRWFIPLVFAAVSCTLGALIMIRPGAIDGVLAHFTGGSIIAEAAMDLFSFFGYRRVIKNYYLPEDGEPTVGSKPGTDTNNPEAPKTTEEA